MSVVRKPLVLLILDGWGYSESVVGNAIAAAKTPNFTRLWDNNPHALLSASGLDVGLPRGQMGNSEVGHMHIGAGRHIFQDLTRIDLAIESGDFFQNPVLTKSIDDIIAVGGALHVLGLLSPGGVHSKDVYLEAMVALAAQRGLKKIYVHAFLDGRDTPPKSALSSIKSMEKKLQELGSGRIASIVGRYYAMDRDNRWDRIKLAYDLLTLGVADFSALDAESALTMAYARGETDEFVKPTCVMGEDAVPVSMQDGDGVVFMNFRSDRARELSYALTLEKFTEFERQARPKLTAYVTLIQYASDLQAQVAYPPERFANVLGEVVANNGLTQLRLAETEKYAHVTYFINGGREEPFANEERILVPSPKVVTYDMQPEMNASQVSAKLVEAVKSGKYDIIICNYANPDMVGHTGKFAVTVQAIEVIDKCLGELDAALKAVQGEMIIIADHGNAEQMLDPHNGEVFTAHTLNPVPFIYVGAQPSVKITKSLGGLVDVAPTMLYLKGIDKPAEMTGESLVTFIE